MQALVSESVRIEMAGAPAMGGYLARPAGAPATGGVLVGMELFGVSAHVRDVCDELASRGLAALAPDFYHRVAPSVELPADDAGRARGLALLARLTRDDAVGDARAAVRFLESHGPLLSMVGLSVGGHLAYLAATRLPIPVVVVAYGGWLTGTDIPLSRPTPTVDATPGITGRVLLLLGGDDPRIGPPVRLRLGDALLEACVDHEIVTYPGVVHGFLCDPAARDAWRRIHAALEEAQPATP